ncbi:hypothetical protein Kpol_1061p33 [Vanderwaltozyma polyspora DSM 70294]|uniref:Nucleoporin NUP60 n=1 Tax=Vanderwaltozyma polyspora (strain ATCC 22028 / DSM 70294 / BCRC 21397 / CBS 2163 / NBRC 10782 / NRRL Y-8283 / UCD 57-17) TaxID=436907 RepID=A7TJF8_VANPO|nr:uncharacterized protein Kpol_1061p33 [Vanderwaltozyma polyspora DSM 70294]EDO17608.1 hypothetical protein Kpol_1061p33 [Vanderwaltozyma polyspora DSM 70294]
MSKNSKQYRKSAGTASGRTKLSFLSKVKSLVNKVLDSSVPTNEDSSDNRGTESSTNSKRENSPLPGGFFNPDTSVSRIKDIVLEKNKKGSFIQEDISVLDSSIIESRENIDANTSNARLAKFFSEKGDQPLSDMEKEGVFSLLNKSGISIHGSEANDSMDLHAFNDFESSRILKASAPSSRRGSFKPPTFIPKYDLSTASNISANSSMRSSTKMRVFDYSSMPSPYRTTVYRYHSVIAGKDNKTSDTSNAVRNTSVRKPVVKESTKKITNTASALISLLENQQVSQQLASNLANPYSSHLTQLQEQKQQMSPAPIDTAKTVAPLNEQRESSKSESKTESIDTEERQSKKNSYNALKPNEGTSQPITFDKYKPNRSSSLRSAVVTADAAIESGSNRVNSPGFPTFQFKSPASSTNIEDQGEAPKKETSTSILKPLSTPTPTSTFNFGESKPTSDVTDTSSSIFKKLEPEPTEIREVFSQPQPAFKFDDKSKKKPFAFSPKLSNKSEEPVIEVEKISDGKQNKIEEPSSFSFENPNPSNIDPNSVAEEKVKKYESMFVF